METIDKSVCELCQWNGKCKHISNCKSNVLGVNVKKQMIAKACEWLKNNTPIGLMEEEITDFLEDFEKAMDEI